MEKKFTISILSCLIIFSSFSQPGDDGWNNRIIDTCENDIELARETIAFVPGFDTEGHNDFHTYIDPDIPFNGGISATNGEFNLNFIRTFTPIHDHKTDTIPAHTGLDYSQWAENITYFDGLGREVQRIIVSGSPYNSDVIQPIVYDTFGRLKEEHLPYAITQSGPDGPGGYRPDPINEKRDFYNNYYPDDKDYAFSNKDFDNSPLNRVLKQYPPGEAWNIGAGKPVEFSYMSNDASIPVFKVKPNDYLKKDGYYTIGTLFKKITIDENGNENIEYKNKSDQVIAKIVSSTDLSGTTLETYYVYDDYGNLRYVISPNAAEEMKNHADGSIGHISTDTTIQQLCYYYQYDDRQRMVLKKLPGAKPVYYVYNKRDQLVLTQDGNHRALDNWLFTKYDALNRPIMTGKYHHTSYLNRVQMQNAVDSSNVFYEDVYLGAEHGYSNNAFPTLTDYNSQIFTVTYYDNYDYINQSVFANRYGFEVDEVDFLYLSTDELPPEFVKGQVTTVKTKILPNTFIPLESGLEYLVSVNYYDKYLRLVQTISDHHLDTIGLDIISHRINFTGDILLTKENHLNGTVCTIVQREFEYDNGKRLKKTKYKITDEGWVTTSEQKYDELGQMNRKFLHGGSDGSLQTINYSYNIRGWLTDMNDISAIGDDFFALNLGYTNDTNQQYNGNISSMEWNSIMFGNNTYNFNYDGANRLIQAVFNETSYYDTEYSYDKNGNILTLLRQGKLGGYSAYDLIDELSYTYSGNQLQSVTDDDGNNFQNNGFSDNGSFSDSEFTYDNNGNMLSDANKILSIIEYNYLNLPQKMFIYSSGFNQINYLYDATGKKLRKKTLADFGVEKTMDYVGSFVYEDDELKYLQTDEGRVMVNSDGSFEYQYYLKDHLGNTRVTFNEYGDVIQEDTYYPFGMQMNGLCFETGLDYKNKYLFNGKELQDDFGLEWYDYGARFYDAQLGRWHTHDPLAENYFDQSPYNYCFNNPMIYVDPNGMAPDGDIDDILNTVNKKQGYNVTVNNETQVTHVTKTEASYSKDKESNNANVNLTLTESVFTIDSEGNTSSVSITESALSATFNEDGVENVTTKQMSTQGYSSEYDGDKIAELSKADPVVNGVSTLLNSSNRDALFSQDGSLPGLSIRDHVENNLSNAVKALTIIIPGKTYDAPGIDYLPSDLDKRTKMNFPINYGGNANARLKKIARRKPITNM